MSFVWISSVGRPSFVSAFVVWMACSSSFVWPFSVSGAQVWLRLSARTPVWCSVWRVISVRAVGQNLSAVWAGQVCWRYGRLCSSFGVPVSVVVLGASLAFLRA